MDTLDSLKRAIFADPENDDLRLRYAALLEQQGYPRAEFIRVQVELARAEAAGESRPELKRREMDLLLEHGEEWAGGRRQMWSSDPTKRPGFNVLDEEDLWAFRRGFLDCGSISARTWLARADEIIDRIPVTELDVGGFYRPMELPNPPDGDLHRFYEKCCGPGDMVAPFAASSQLLRLRRLTLHCWRVGDPGVCTLVASPYLGRLTGLVLNLASQSGEIARSLVKNPHLSGLQDLTIGYFDDQCYSGEFGDGGLETLATAGHLRNLSKLAFFRGRLGAAGIEALMASPLLETVRELELAGSPWGPDGVRAVANSPTIGRLRKLDLSGNGGADEGDKALGGEAAFRLGAEGTEALCRSPYLTNLTHLALGLNALDGDAAKIIAGTSALRNLTDLELCLNEITAEGARALAASPHLRQLARLDLGCNWIGDEGIAALLYSPVLGGIQEVDLSSNLLTDATLEALGRSPHLRHLRRLDLRNNRFTARGLNAFLQSPNSACLTHLHLDLRTGSEPDDEMVMALANAPNLSQLNELAIRVPRLTPAGAKCLVDSPNLRSLTLLRSVGHQTPEVSRILTEHWGDRVEIGKYG
jgi:uncharacterized protein (TIGR02996 family)